MNNHASQPSRSSRSHGPDSPALSSGAATPTGSTSASSSTFLPSSVSGLWGGLVRRFSSDMVGASSDSTSPSLSASTRHSRTYPISHNNGIDGVFTPPHTRRTASPMRPPPLEPLSLRGYRDDTPPAARLLSTAIAEEIRIMVPARLCIVDEWNLVYSLDQDGASLSTLYEKCRSYEGKRVGFVLVIKDCDGGIFGAYLSDFPRPAPSYFGTGECFLWRASLAVSLPPPPSADTAHLARTTTIAASTTGTINADQLSSTQSAASSHPSETPGLLSPTPIHPDIANDNNSGTTPMPVASPSIRFRAFPYSGVNEYYMFCESHFLSVGGGDGRYGLWLDDSLARGVSSSSLTFGNEPLSDEGTKFGILGVEVWVIGGGQP